jgi:hypothetical protein
MMKVAINRCWGGFGLSDEAIELCIEYGMTCVDHKDKSHESADFVTFNRRKDNYYAHHSHEHEFRTHPVVIRVIEELGDEANGPRAELDIVEIPFDSCDGWYIDDYDGKETIHETHSSW